MQTVCDPIRLYVDQEDEDKDKDKEEEDADIKEETKRKSYVRLKRLCQSNVYKFTGGCLIGVNSPLDFAEKYFKDWTEDIPSLKRIQDWYKKDSAELDSRIEALEKS